MQRRRPEPRGFRGPEQRIERTANTSANIQHAAALTVQVSTTPRNINVKDVCKREPRPVHVHYFNVVGDECRRRVITTQVVGIHRLRARVCTFPRARFLLHCSLFVDQQGVTFADVATKGACAGKRGVFVITHVVGNVQFIEMIVGARE